MDAPYHVQILERVLSSRVSGRALDAITRANLAQDRLGLLIGHPEYHFDDNTIPEGLAYIETCRGRAAQALLPPEAWAAFGRLTHAAQDFYAHSNYVRLWAEQHAPAWPDLAGSRALPPPAAIDGLDASLLHHPDLKTCRVYLPLEALYFVPGLAGWVKKLLPADSHARMNLDAPASGPLFAYALEAAVQRTAAEFERTLALMGEEAGERAVAAFCDHA